MNSNTSKNFVLQLGSLAALYASLAALITLLFGVITILIPDAAAGYWEYESATSSIRFSIATLVVFFPTYIVLTRLVNNARRNDSEEYLSLTKWLIYLSLFVGGAIILGDAVAVILGFLNGELTMRFILKALVLATFVITAFFYYVMDVRGYWQKNEKHSIYMGILMTVSVVAALILGFQYMETPAEVREMRIDENQVTDLQNIQYGIEEYYRLNETLPTDLNMISSGLKLPIAPEDRSAYQYEVTGENTYKLCADFKKESSNGSRTEVFYPGMDANYNWNHGAGNWCFERKITNK